MKKEKKTINVTPNKRLFWSIISDYSLNTSICELIDNALDLWLKRGKTKKLCVNLDLDIDRRKIRIIDNAGGIPEAELKVLISPGSSLNDPNEIIIGMFGVGSKRAVIALAENIKIRTRYESDTTFQIDVDDDWLKDEDWEIPVYDVDEIPPRTTMIDLYGLRYSLTEKTKDELIIHLQETYSQFLKNENFEIIVNSKSLIPMEFDQWAYPPEFEPRYYMFEIPAQSGERVGVEIYGGLVLNRDPVKENYGVYFYCNDRLICKAVKDRDVGYMKGYAGIPHPDASLARVIVKFQGPANRMPWNSTKSAINYGHPIFQGLYNVLVPIITDFSSLSRRLKGQWNETVYQYKKGEIKYIEFDDVQNVNKSYLPPLPKVRKKTIDHLKENNADVLEDKPWVSGLLDALAAQEVIGRQPLETKNRIALILLDSTFEIALKEYIVHEKGLNKKGKSLKELFRNRSEVISVVKQNISFEQKTMDRIEHYYLMRNKLIHERATVDVTNTDINNFREAINECLSLLFGTITGKF